jgi:hypothetical protein
MLKGGKRMRNTNKILLTIVLVAATVITAAPTGAKADYTGSKDHVKSILKVIHDGFGWLKKDSDYEVENFNPSKSISYGEIAQWIYYDYLEIEALRKDITLLDDLEKLHDAIYPTKKESVKWLKKVFLAVAKEHPEYAETFAEIFMDGQEGKFNYKKSASWKWIVGVSYVQAYYRRSPFSKRNEFDFDLTRFDLDMFGYGEDGSVKSLPVYIHGRWQKTYGGSEERPSKIEALDALILLCIRW